VNDSHFYGTRRKKSANRDPQPHTIAFRTVCHSYTIFSLSTLLGVNLGRWLGAGYPVREYHARQAGWAHDQYENVLALEWRCVRKEDTRGKVCTIR
jgi:hypothetical protein